MVGNQGVDCNKLVGYCVWCVEERVSAEYSLHVCLGASGTVASVSLCECVRWVFNNTSLLVVTHMYCCVLTPHNNQVVTWACNGKTRQHTVHHCFSHNLTELLKYGHNET